MREHFGLVRSLVALRHSDSQQRFVQHGVRDLRGAHEPLELVLVGCVERVGGDGSRLIVGDGMSRAYEDRRSCVETSSQPHNSRSNRQNGTQKVDESRPSPSGLDSLVFSGSIGENSHGIMDCVCEGLGHLGIAVDRRRNAAGELLISANTRSTKAQDTRTDEEARLARAAIRFVVTES
jgi:hypothetical protein